MPWWSTEAAAILVATVWLVQGGFNKLLHGAPRHLAIVQAVPGLAGTAGEIALIAVGIAEVAIAWWVLSGWMPRLCAATQTIVLLSMNACELIFARDLLVWPAGLIPTNLVLLAAAWFSALTREPVSYLTALQRHPLEVKAHLENCLTLTYAVPAHVLRPLIPRGLSLETIGDYGFVAVALVETKALRPALLPRTCGQDFVLAGYRVFTRFAARRPVGRVGLVGRAGDSADSSERQLRGLRILRSDANRVRMVLGGNVLTHYKYHRSVATMRCAGSLLDVAVDSRDGYGDLRIRADLSDHSLPPTSPFDSLRAALRFAGPLPFTFDYEAATDSIIAIKATRANWKPRPVRVDVRKISFFDQPMFRGCTPKLAAAFHVRAIDYGWQRGVRYPLAARAEVAP